MCFVDIVVKCVKLLHAGPGLDPDGTMKAELISRVTELFRSPHDSHKLRLLKAIVLPPALHILS